MKVSVTLFMFVVGLAAFVGCQSSPPNAAYRPDWLPSAAKVVFDSRWEDGFLGDAAYKLKARVTHAEFDSAVSHLGLLPYREVPPSTYTNEPPQWMGELDKRWDPTAELEDSFVLKQGRWWQLAKYRNGFLYYQSVRY